MVHSSFGAIQAEFFPGRSSRVTLTSRLVAFLAASALLCLPTSPAAAADPFYEGLLRDGAAAFQRKDYPEAELNLRLACFGLLDDMELLPEGLVRLALAQEAAGNAEGFQESFRRILEIEERFEAYSKHPPEPALRALFETQLVAHVPEGLLGSQAAFESVRRRKVVERLNLLPKGEQIQRLDALIAESPGERLWRLRRATMALDGGSPEQAVPHLDALLTQDPNDDEARCLRGQSLVLNHCPQAVADLKSCPQRTESPRLAYDLADCLVEMGDLEGASQFLSSLQGQALSDRALSKLQRRVERDLQRQRKQQTAAGVDPGEAVDSEELETLTPELEIPETKLTETVPPETAPSETVTPRNEEPAAKTSSGASSGAEDLRSDPPPPSSTPQPSSPAPRAPQPLTGAQQARLDEARDRLVNARRTADLEPALAAAKEVADARKDSPEAQHLAGEIAYRSSRWEEAAIYFRRGGDPTDSRPNLLFFMAVSYFETGDLAAARNALERCLPKLQRTEFVEAYRRKIQE